MIQQENTSRDDTLQKSLGPC